MSPEDRKESERRQMQILGAHLLAIGKRPNGRALLQDCSRHISGAFAALDELLHLSELEEDEKRTRAPRPTAVIEGTRRLA